MSFREWLYNRLVADDYIDECNWKEEDINFDDLCENTDLEAYELESYIEDFKEYCADMCIEPIMDVEGSL